MLKPEFVNHWRSPGIDSQPGRPVQQPYMTYRPTTGYRFLGFLNVYKFGLGIVTKGMHSTMAGLYKDTFRLWRVKSTVHLRKTVYLKKRQVHFCSPLRLLLEDKPEWIFKLGSHITHQLSLKLVSRVKIYRTTPYVIYVPFGKCHTWRTGPYLLYILSQRLDVWTLVYAESLSIQIYIIHRKKG
jgi:hypothetical protein